MPQTNPDYFDHPVFNPNRLHLITPAMQELSDTVHRLLWTGTTGGFITGAARVGKTTAVLNLADQIRTRSGQSVPTTYTTIPLRDQHTIASVFRQLCWNAHLVVKPLDRADHLGERYVHHIADRAAAADCPYAVLLVDEMQHLQASQFNAFAELYDQLRLLGIALMVVFVGNDQESSGLLAATESEHYAHIHGRFFTQASTFRGLTRHEEVRACLVQYDRLRYPDNGPTYTAYFLPDAVRQGWRLASLSRDIWRVFRGYQTTYRIPSWGMQYFTATINTLLSDFLPHHGVDQFDDEMVHECIRVSGLVPALVNSRA